MLVPEILAGVIPEILAGCQKEGSSDSEPEIQIERQSSSSTGRPLW